MKKSKKIVIIISIIVAIIAIYIASTFLYSYYQKISFEKALTQAIAKNNEINLNDITSFEWDNFYIFLPYTTTEYINKMLGYNWLRRELLGLQYDENQLLVFTKDKKVVMSIILQRSKGDFINNKILKFSPNEAIFVKNGNDLLKR